jgi:hypothetical protein
MPPPGKPITEAVAHTGAIEQELLLSSAVHSRHTAEIADRYNFVSCFVFFLSCLCYLFATFWWLECETKEKWTLAGAIGFIVEPFFDFLCAWHSGGKEQSKARGSVFQWAVRDYGMWAAFVFFLASVAYLWQAMIPFLYDDYAYNCTLTYGFWWKDAGCPDYYYEGDYDDEYEYDYEDCDYSPPEVGYCNSGWFGSLLFIVDGFLALKEWHVQQTASGNDTNCTNFIASHHAPPEAPRSIFHVDLYLVAVVSFVLGAINDTLNYNVWWSGSNGPWASVEWSCLGSSIVWLVSAVCYLLYCFKETSIIKQIAALLKTG